MLVTLSGKAEPPAGVEPEPRPPPAAQGTAGAGRQAARERARDHAFEAAQDQAQPMRPDQLEALIRSLETTEAVSSLQNPPKTVCRTESLNLNAPTPPVVRVAQGWGSTLAFYDRTGRIWPVTAQQGFNNGLFTLSAGSTTGNKEDLPTLIMVQPVAPYGAGNLMVALKGLEKPLMFTVALGQTEVDSCVEYKLALAGPNATPEYRAPSPQAIDAALLNVLNGLPPLPAAVPVEISGVEPDALAWRVDGDLYIRTVAELYSPEYSQRASQPSGVHAYKLPRAPVLLMSFNGALTEVVTQE